MSHPRGCTENRYENSGECCSPGEQRELTREGLAGRVLDRHRHDFARLGEAAEVHDLVMGAASAHAARVVARRAFDEDVDGAADKPLGALARAGLDELDEAFDAL